ncbi:MAG TPA: nucleotidyltransferase domain-containing protein [Thermoanaerobaculia bacterium]|nr:nucleotidyltransferase domain-containing protein [Thermoanaerobaculia bacterium]
MLSAGPPAARPATARRMRRRRPTRASGVDAIVARIVGELAGVPGIAAVAVGGSWARGEADAHSDVDLGLYYDAARPPRVARLRALARKVGAGPSASTVTALGGWGPWIDGGAWLEIEGRRVDWIYRDLSSVEKAISGARRGAISSHYQPGHPHAFHSYIYAGEVHYARILHDPRRRLEDLQRRTRPYPSALRRAIRDAFLWEAQFALETAAGSARREDALHVAGSLFRSAACLLQVLFAANGRYFVNEKGALAATDAFRVRPPRFAARVKRILSRPGGRSPALESSLERMGALAREVRDL